MAKIQNDKYYTSPELAQYCVKKTKEIIGEDNITEYIEPSAGSGVFLDYLDKPYLAYDIEPEDERIIKQDWLTVDLDYIKNSITQSPLCKIFNLDIVDWGYCDEFATKNLIRQVCQFYNNNPNMPNYKIAEEFKLNKLTIGRYLLTGNKFGWCNYDYVQKNYENAHKQGICNGIKTKVIKDGKVLGIYNSASEIQRISLSEFGVMLWQTQISLCCKTHKKHKGFYFEYA